MSRVPSTLAAVLACAPVAAPAARADDAPPAAAPARVSFLKDVAPILARRCIACHNARKAEGRYDMTSFARLAKGGQQGEDLTLEPGDPGSSLLVELIRPDGRPRMPYKQDPLPPEQVALIERWIGEGAEYDGPSPTEDWVALRHRTTPVEVPERYPAAVPITALAFRPDGTAIAAAGDHEVNLWRTADGTLARRLRVAAGRIGDIAYSPDGRWLATAGGDPGRSGTVQLWGAEPDGGGTPVRVLVESSDCALAVTFSPDSRLLAAAGADRVIRIWEVESGAAVATIEDHADWVLDLAFSPDGRRLASASRDRTSKVFDVATKATLATFPGHADTVSAVAFAPDGRTVASGGGDHQVRLWDPGDEGKQVRALGAFEGAVFQLRFHPDGRRLIACGADRTVRVLDPGASGPVLRGHRDWVYALALSPDGQCVASGSWDGEVRLWSLADGRLLRTILAAPGFERASAAGASW